MSISANTSITMKAGVIIGLLFAAMSAVGSYFITSIEARQDKFDERLTAVEKAYIDMKIMGNDVVWIKQGMEELKKKLIKE